MRRATSWSQYLRWNRQPIGPALRAGLLTRGGVEFLAGRIVVPDLRGGRPTWLIGRRLDDQPDDEAPAHLGLPGKKPLLGLDAALASPTVVVVEGSFDYLTVKMWGYPVVATLGTHLRPDSIDALRAFDRQYLVLDNDDAGFQATLTLQQELGPTAIPVALPDGVKDPSQLGRGARRSRAFRRRAAPGRGPNARRLGRLVFPPPRIPYARSRVRTSSAPLVQVSA